MFQSSGASDCFTGQRSKILRAFRELWGHCVAQIQRRHVGTRPKRRILSGFAAVEEVASWRTPAPAPAPAPAPPPPSPPVTRTVSEPLLVQRLGGLISHLYRVESVQDLDFFRISTFDPPSPKINKYRPFVACRNQNSKTPEPGTPFLFDQ